MKYILGFMTSLVLSILSSLAIMVWVMIYFLWEVDFKGAVRLRKALFNRLIEEVGNNLDCEDIEQIVKFCAYFALGIVAIALMFRF